MRRDAPPPDDTLHGPQAARARILALAAHPLARALARAAERERPLLVGGALRDAALGHPPREIDAVVARDGGDVARRLGGALPARVVRLAPGRFAAWRVISAAGEIDLWDLEGSALEADLARRDLTVNALALDLGSGAIIDPHRGLADLARRRLRAVRLTTFSEDPLRVLRLARFATTLPGFAIEAATAAAARRAAPGLERIAGERIRDEVAALAGHPAAAQRALARVGAFPGLWSAAWATSAPAGHLSSATRYERGLVAAGIDLPADARVAGEHALRLALSLPREVRARRLEVLAERAILSRAERRAALALLAPEPATPPTGEDLAVLVWRAGRLWASALALAAALAPAAAWREWAMAIEAARRAVAERGDSLVAPRPLVAGTEAAAITGTPPGPRLGRALRALVEAQVRGRVRTAEEARAWLAARAQRRES